MTKDVIGVQWAGDCRLVLTFEGGEHREIDIAELVRLDGIFEALRDPSYFRQVRVEPEVGTIVWPNGADVCPDVLYEHSRPVSSDRVR